jgi:C4-dicarboxylate-specific signal transduction histidine kinase
MTRKSSRQGRAATPATHVTRQRRSWIERSSPAESIEHGRRTRQLADELYRTGYALTIEHLVSWLIHEISQPLMATVATAQAARRLLGRRRPNLREIGQSIEEVMAYQRRAGKIIQRLRTVLPKREPKRTRLDVTELFLEVVRFLTARGDLQGTRVRLSFPRDPLSVRGARMQLRQVFLNLILSAVEAMRGTPARQRKLWVTAVLASEPATIHITMRDSTVQARKADSIRFPGALTRAHLDVTAPGLAVAVAVVAEHGGRIWAKGSRRGAELHVMLPVEPDRST